jgi:cell division septation protein DedD
MNETLGRRLVGATVLIGLGILLPFMLIQWLDGPEPEHGDGVRVYEITPGGEARPVVEHAPEPEPELRVQSEAPESPVAPTRTEAPQPSPEDEPEPDAPSWSVQVGSFRSEENARTLTDRLAADFPAFYNEGEVGGATYYRVLLGPYAREAEAESAASALAARGYQARIRREP